MCVPDQQHNLASLFAFSAFRVLLLTGLWRHCGYAEWQRSHGLKVRPISVIPHFTFRIPQFCILPTTFCNISVFLIAWIRYCDYCVLLLHNNRCLQWIHHIISHCYYSVHCTVSLFNSLKITFPYLCMRVNYVCWWLVVLTCHPAVLNLMKLKSPFKIWSC